ERAPPPVIRSPSSSQVLAGTGERTMYARAALKLVTLAVALAVVPAAARADEDLVGTWEGMSGSGGFTEVWTIKMDKGGWSVSTVYLKNGKEAGGFRGKDVKFASGTLTFVQDFVKKPDTTWADGTVISAMAKGDKLTFEWKNTAGSGTVNLSRA